MVYMCTCEWDILDFIRQKEKTSCKQSNQIYSPLSAKSVSICTRVPGTRTNLIPKPWRRERSCAKIFPSRYHTPNYVHQYTSKTYCFCAFSFLKLEEIIRNMHSITAIDKVLERNKPNLDFHLNQPNIIFVAPFG